MTVIKIRRLAELDLALHGRRFILPEFAAGVIAPAGLGLYTLSSIHSSFATILGVYLLLLGLNYLPILIYAVAASRRLIERVEYSTAPTDLKREIKKYSLQQVILFLPLATLLLALIQELTRTPESSRRNP